MASNSILAKLAVLISGDASGLNKPLAEANSKLQGFSNSTKTAQSSVTSLTGGLSKMGAAVGVAFGAFSAISVVKGAVRTLADFEQQMATVRAITGATTSEFKALQKSALDLGASTRYTSKQVAELQTEYGRLGFTTQEILDATGATLDLATATGEDLAKSADVAGSTIRGFGLAATETRRVVDVMAESFNASALGLENFRESMKYVAPIAAQAGISVEETTALLGTLADAGIRGSQAGTSLRKIITDIGDESGTLSEKLQKLAARGLSGADAMDEVGRTAYASLLILANNTEKTAALTTQLENASGAASKAAEIMGDTLAGDLTKLESAYEGLILAFSEGGGVIRDLVQALTEIVVAATNLAKGSSEVGKFFKGIVDQITAPVRALGALAGWFNKTQKAAEDNTEKLRAIESTVKAAFDSGNIEAYIKALDQNIYKEEIIAEIRRRQAEEDKKRTQALIESIEVPLAIIPELEARLKSFEEKKKSSFSTKEIGEFNVKIQELRDELAVLNAIGNESGFLKNLEAQQSVGITPEIKDPSVLPEVTNPFPTVIDVDIEPYKQKLAELSTLTADYHVDQETKTAQAIARQQAIVDAQERTNQSAMQFGETIGRAFGEAAAGQISFKDAMKRTTGEILKMFLQRALAGVIAGATTTPAPPPVILALAAAGMAGISALFSSIGASGGGGGGGSTSTVPRAKVEGHSPLPSRSSEISQVEFVIHGNDLVSLTNSQNNKNDRLRG